MTKVFISYSHDSPEHRDSILAFSDQVREDGVDCYIDQYVNGAPADGWQRWMEKQIQSADFVLVVCTPTYLKRFNGEDRTGGRGVNFEGVIISQVLYDNFQQNTKLIPVITDDGSLNNVPLILKSGSTYMLGKEYETLYRVLTNQPLATAKPLGKLKHYNSDCPPPIRRSIHSDRLPTVKGDFFGREAEMQLLTNAWQQVSPARIIQFIAPGGTGKTKLLRHWLDHTDDIDALIAWSFYSQGASENKQISTTRFFTHAFAKLGSEHEIFATEEDKGEHLADLLRDQRCVLVLDGLEPLQHAGCGMRGELKDRAIRQLLKNLAGRNRGLCIITARIPVHELTDRQEPSVISHQLQNLSLTDSVTLLRSLGVKGKLNEMRSAVREYGCHALALNLLGNVLRLRYQGDVNKRDAIKALINPSGSKESRHAFKVMQAYEEWFVNEPELRLLHLLGLFDHPIGQEVLQVLWDAQIPHLTADIGKGEWLETISVLREEHHLLSQHHDGDGLDCHPLIREYFGRKLQAQQPEAWKQAHKTLYDYYKALPEKELPDTLEEMLPLFRAVAHGCAAGLHQQVLDEVYWKRISRKKHYFLYKKGAIGDDLATLIHFFKRPWETPVDALNTRSQAQILRSAGHRLRAMGRVLEAVTPLTTALKYYEQLDDSKEIAITSSHLIEPHLTLGNVREALKRAKLSVKHPDSKFARRLECVSIFARTLHQSGLKQEALRQFDAAEALQHKSKPKYRYLHSLPGFRYCELLLEEERLDEVFERASYALTMAKATQPNPLYRGLSLLVLGRVSLHRQQLDDSRESLDNALFALRKAGNQDHLPRGLLARAALHRQTKDFTSARKDLEEILGIADPSGMRLHLTDYYLELARLLIVEGYYPAESISRHLDCAEKLISETGYHRRDAELAELRL